MAKYRKKPVVREATQWFPGKDVPGVIDLGAAVEGGPAEWAVRTAQGKLVTLTRGDYVVTEPDGSGHYPVKPEIFESEHEPLE